MKLVIKHFPTAKWPFKLYLEHEGKLLYLNGFSIYIKAKRIMKGLNNIALPELLERHQYIANFTIEEREYLILKP